MSITITTKRTLSRDEIDILINSLRSFFGICEAYELNAVNRLRNTLVNTRNALNEEKT